MGAKGKGKRQERNSILLQPTALMRKITKFHHGKVNLRRTSRKNLRVWRHLTVREIGVWPKRNRITRWGKREDRRPTFHYIVEHDGEEQTFGELHHLVQRNAGGAQWTWEKVTVAVDSGAAENVIPKSMFTEISTEEAERSKNGKGFKGQDESISRSMDSRSCPSELIRGKSTWQVAEDLLRRHLTSSKPEATCSSGRFRHTSRTGSRRRNRCSERKATCTC